MQFPSTGYVVSNPKKITPMKEFLGGGGRWFVKKFFLLQPKTLVSKSVFQFEPQISLVLAPTPTPHF